MWCNENSNLTYARGLAGVHQKTLWKKATNLRGEAIRKQKASHVKPVGVRTTHCGSRFIQWLFYESKVVGSE